MKERPILFSGEMVRAILEGRKTQTRRVITPQPNAKAAFRNLGTLKSVSSGTHPHIGKFGAFFNWSDGDFPQCEMSPSPYGKPGNRLWVRETHARMPMSGFDMIAYRATAGTIAVEGVKKWTPSIFMPRKLSRITLEITQLSVELVQEISEEDAKAEGADPIRMGEYSTKLLGQEHLFTPRMETDPHALGFAALWDSINAKRGYGWDKCPWVWVIEFKRV